MRSRSILFTAASGLLIACPSTDVVVGGSSSGGSGSETSMGTAGTETAGDGDGDAGDGDAGDGDGDEVVDHRTFFIGESTKFDGGGLCDNDGLNAVTSSLRDALVDAGWTGLRFVDDNTWPEDFRESTISDAWLDGSFGDTARLAVYAGHGNVGLLQWGRPSDNGACLLTINAQARLGKLAGDTAAATMLMTSCTLRADQLWPVLQDQASRHFLGYHDSPYIGHDEPRKVFERCQDGQSTADAWLEEMVLNGGGKTSPVVFTMGTSVDEATSMHGSTNLASGVGLLENVGEPADYYHFELFDSGCTKFCGNCSSNNAPLPEAVLSAPQPRVKLTRPVRSASDLVAHAGSLLLRFEVGPLDAIAQARLQAWADAVVQADDVTYAQILDEPRIDLSYDPTSDLLRITDRDALARARPGPDGVVDDPPDLRDTLQLEAQAVLGGFQSLPGTLDWLGTEFEVTTRSVGYGSRANPQAVPIPFEYMFTLPGRLESFALPDRSLGIGITRLGELSTITVSMVEVEIVGVVGWQRAPQEAMAALGTTVLTQHPSARGIEFIAPSVGYQLAEGELSTEAVPSLLVGYVLEFGPADAPVASRRVPVRISLIEPNAPIESLSLPDSNPHPGDPRDSN